MTGETKHAYAINAKVPTSKENDSAFEQFNKDTVDNKSTGASDSSKSALIADTASQLNGRKKESHGQREAVIRPQQAGKIDFKSLQNRPKFSSEGTWTNGKNIPLSPTGKSRGKDKNKRTGKGDRNQQQLYRLSISSSRANPTIGIAYPQQKVTPPKKVEVSGSYRFHVPSIPEREAELHQEDVNFNRSLSEPTSSLTSTNYTSQTVPASRIPHGLKIQPGNLHDTVNSNGQLHYLEFPPNGNSWHSPEKHFPGTSGYAISSQKLCPFPEDNKSDSHSFVPVSFQYPFPSLQDHNGNSFCNNGNNQDFVDAALTTNQVAHNNTFFFQSSSREGPEDQQGNGSYNTVLPDSRTYVPSHQTPFVHAQQGIQHPPTTPCYTGRNEHPADHSGAISSNGALNSSGAIEQTQSTFQENQSVFNPSEFSLHSNSMPALLNKRQQSPKDFVHSQGLLAPGNTLRRNIPQTSLNKVQFASKLYTSVNTGSVPFDKNISRIPQTWDAGSNNFPPLDQSAVSYSNASGNLIPYQCQSNDQRQALKNPRIPWQQSQLNSTTSSQNGVELSRNAGKPKIQYSHGNSDWPNSNTLPKISPSYHAKNHLMVEGSSTQRNDMNRQNYNFSNDVLYDSVKETNSQISDSRSKGLLYGMSQPIQQPRTNINQPVQLSGNNFVAESPCESPLNSPINNPVSGSTCSSLSPMSSSPVNPSSDENQMPPTLISSPYFHQPCHPTEKSFNPTDSLASGSRLYYNTEPTKSFNFLSDASKDEQAFKNVQDNQYQKLANEPSKSCIENFESEPPPPYSSHHFLASSLSSANLDQLDVLLTCKQCDQNFGNLSSFLEHRQYCNLNSTIQNEMKDSLHGDMRKSATDPLKSSQTMPGLSHPKGQMEFHSPISGFNKDYLLDSDTKGCTREDPMKCNIFHSLTPGLLPLAACDTLDMDDAKLDSLINEALNGLEFQVDNPEIESTFIDVFVDDDLTTSKAITCSQQHKVKESTETIQNVDVEEKQAQHNQVTYEENYESEAPYNHRTTVKTSKELKITEVETTHRFSLNSETNLKPLTATSEWQNTDHIKKCITAQEKNKCKPDFENSDEKTIKNYDSHQGRTMRNDSQEFSITDTPKSRKNSLQDIKKKKPHNGTWSKELIHKIVQQKNKFHKLHVKSNKNVQFSLVTERLFPPNKSNLFGEYDYISDSDEEVVANALPGKMPTGRLKYSFNRDLQGRGNRTKIKEPVWRMGEATRFQLQNKDLRNTNKETSNRVRRRSSQSSNSSDQSTSISSETGSSPKSTERTDSETEQENVLMCNSFSTSTQKTAIERNMIKPIYRDNVLEKHTHQDFSKGTKQFGSAKFLLASSKAYPSNNINDGTHYGETDKIRQSTDSMDENTNKTSKVHCFKKSEEEDQLSTYQKAVEASTTSQDHFSSDLIIDMGSVSQQGSSFHVDNTNYQEKQLDSCVPAIPSTEVNKAYSNNNVRYLNDMVSNGDKDFAMPMPCYLGDSTVNILPQENHKAHLPKCQEFPETKDMPNLYGNNMFSKNQRVSSTDIEQMFVNQSNTNNMISIENKCSDIISYPSENQVSSVLSFDSSSIFADLPITHFESPLYNSITPCKDYVDYDQSNKSTPFEHQFPEFLQEKSWDLLGECAPMSSSSLSTFQVLENQSTEKYNEHAPVSSEQMSIDDIPRTITDYNVPFINNMSDELEIKRLVTELENQLQTSKHQNDMTSQTLSKHQLTPELTDSSVTLQEMEDNTIENCSKDAYFNETENYVNNMKHIIQVDHLQDSQPLLKVDDSSESLKRSWTSSAQFDTFTSGIKSHKQDSTLDSFTIPENCKQYQPAVTNACLTEDMASLSNQSTTSVQPDGCLTNLSHQDECQTDLLRETLVTAETQLSKIQQNIDNADKEIKQSDVENQMNKLQKLDDQFDEPPELEPFQSVSEFVLQDKNDLVLNITKTPDHDKNIPEEPLCNPVLKSTISKTVTDMEHNKKHFILGDEECLQKTDSMPVLVKEECAKPEKVTLAEQSADNPLQQLQQFVARTAKNNEVEMLMPCFPMLLKASGTAETRSDIESDSSHAEEGISICTVDSDITAKTAKHKEMPLLSESCKLSEETEQIDNSSEMPLKTISNDVHIDGKSANNLENKCSGPNVINIGKSVKRLDSDNLPSKSRISEKLSQRLVQDNEDISNYCEADGIKSSSFMKEIKSTSCNHTFHNEAYTARSILKFKKLSPDKTDDSYLNPDVMDAQVEQISKSAKKDHEPQNVDNDVSVFTSPEDHQQHVDIMQEAELLLATDNTKESSKLNGDKCASDSVDKASTDFSLHPTSKKVLANPDNQYHTKFPTLSMSTAHSVLGFDLLPRASLKESTQQQDFMLTSTDNNLISIERHALSQVTQKSQNELRNIEEVELEKHSVAGTDVSVDKNLTLSLDGCQKIEAEKDSVKPVLGGNLTPCFCSELVCTHYKDEHAESVTDIILGCQAIPANDAYQIYTGENNQNFPALENKLFSESTQTTVVPSLRSQKEGALKCDWHNTQGGSTMERVFTSEEDDLSSAMVCDLMDITDPGLMNIDVHQKTTENLAASLVPQFSNAKEAENITLNEDLGKKCTNDMHSVIDGVLRILEGDKSKEILQSIGLPQKSNPIKEKKSGGLSLTCDICSVSFRSKPGLTRHKAVKHNGSVTYQKDVMSKARNVKNKICQWNGSNDSQQVTQSQNINASLLNPDYNLHPPVLIPDKEKNKGEKRTNGQCQDADSIDSAYKKKLDGKIKKRKVKITNKSMDSQGPPDDVLNILKTNILKAIGQSNSFNSSEEKICWEESSDKHTALKEPGLKNVNLETYPAAISNDEEEMQVGDTLDLKMQGRTLLNEHTWTKSLTDHDEQSMPKDHTLLTGEEEHLNTVDTVKLQKDTHVSNLSKETVTDLHSLFDDDNSFSQLFPRDDHLTRRKCTRVYGKRSKKQIPSFEADLKRLEMVEHCHPPQINYDYDHRRISSDSTLMDSNKPSAQTEHFVHFDHAEPPNKTNEGNESKILSFVDQNQAENISVPQLIEGIQDEKDLDVSTHVSLYKPCGESSEMISDQRDSEVEVNKSSKLSDETGLPEFPTIDMKMLSAKFDMRELSFFSACGDDSDQYDLDTSSDITQKPARRKKQSKNKMDEKRQMRNRNSLKMKTKDKQYKCKVCFQWFLTLGELDFHKLTHNPSPPPTCYMCVQRKFSSREQLRDHLKEKHAKNKAGLWICGMCLKEISDVWMYNEHLREHATQFARKGQAQKSVMGIPGCFGEDSMVRTFLSTFIYRTPSKLSKTSEANDKSPVSKRLDQKEHKVEDEVVSEKETDNSAPAAPIHVKISVSPSLDSSQKNDITHKNAAMHPHCKDPSRDCHHCGKQFPKPFKLQRHLVVHSLQKIYLCHKCPKSYQEVQELRQHLNNDHQLTDKCEIKHTTLYACELCADVMHVIKKSFICSTCNYTFSKKEQYDRHMEKHLIGGSLTFKFRGVTRPTTSAKEIKGKKRDSATYEGMPPSKKQKLSNYIEPSAKLEEIDHGDPHQCPMLSPSVAFNKEMEGELKNEYEYEVKLEEILMDAPELHAEETEERIIHSPEMCSFSPKSCGVEVEEKDDTESVSETFPMLDCEMTIPSFDCAAKTGDLAESEAEFTKMKEISTCELTTCKQVKETNEPPEMETSNIIEEKDLFQLPLENPTELFVADKIMPLPKNTSKESQLLEQKVEVEDTEDTSRSLLIDGTEPVIAIPPKENIIVTDTNGLIKDLKGLKKMKSNSQLNGRSAAQTSITAANGEEMVKPSTPRLKAIGSSAKDNSSSTLKETASQQKLPKREPYCNTAKNSSDIKTSDKMSASMPPKQHQKKRKEHKIPGHKASMASQENLVGEVKKKTNKLAVNGKSEAFGNAKKPEWATSHLDTKDESMSGRPYPKPNAGGISGQLKKVVSDMHNQKKVNSHPSNGEYKCKKTLLTKTLQPFTPKSSALTLNSPSQKRKMGSNAKPTEPLNYRTAESQNNLLSQLFGQKLTSFKIPLRRDIAE